MIGLSELLVIGLIILVIFGTKRLSRFARTTKAAVEERVSVVNPVTGETEFTLMTPEKELAIGKQSHAKLRKGGVLYEDAALQGYLREVGLRVARASHQPKGPWHFSIVDDSVPNAFAIPGGYVYITRGLLAYLCDEAELPGSWPMRLAT
mgnify:CR=1 FL=1